MPYHDAVTEAFARIQGVELYELGNYTHIHGPNCPCTCGKGRCTNHLAVVERLNGTVAPHKDIALAMGATQRPDESIQSHPLGYSNGPRYGNFGWAFDVATVRRRWNSYDDFARAVVLVADKCDRW